MHISVLIPSELRWLAKWVRPYLRWHIGSFLSISISSVLALVPPLILKWLIDDVLPGRRPVLLMLAVAMILLCHLARSFFTAVGNYLTSHAVQRFSLDLRLRVLEHLDILSATHHDCTSVGAAVYPLQEPVDEIAYFGSDLVPAILRTSFAATFTLVTMLALNPGMTFAIVPLIPVFVAIRVYFTHR